MFHCHACGLSAVKKIYVDLKQGLQPSIKFRRKKHAIYYVQADSEQCNKNPTGIKPNIAGFKGDKGKMRIYGKSGREGPNFNANTN